MYQQTIRRQSILWHKTKNLPNILEWHIDTRDSNFLGFFNILDLHCLVFFRAYLGACNAGEKVIMSLNDLVNGCRTGKSCTFNRWHNTDHMTKTELQAAIPSFTNRQSNIRKLNEYYVQNMIVKSIVGQLS